MANIIDRIEELEALGFKRWQKAGYDRLYINATRLGLEVTYYKTGNVSSAYFDDERISNCKGKALLNSKTYIDVKTGKVHSTDSILADKAKALAGIA